MNIRYGVNIITSHVYMPTRKGFCIAFREKKTSSARNSNPGIRNKQYLFFFF